MNNSQKTTLNELISKWAIELSKELEPNENLPKFTDIISEFALSPCEELEALRISHNNLAKKLLEIQELMLKLDPNAPTIEEVIKKAGVTVNNPTLHFYLP